MCPFLCPVGCRVFQGLALWPRLPPSRALTAGGAAPRGGVHTSRRVCAPGRWQHPRGCRHPKRPLGGDVRPRMLLGAGGPVLRVPQRLWQRGEHAGIQPGISGTPPSLLRDRGGGGVPCPCAQPCQPPRAETGGRSNTAKLDPPASSLPLGAPGFWCFSKRQPGRGARGTSASQRRTGSGLHRPAPCLCPAPLPARSSRTGFSCCRNPLPAGTGAGDGPAARTAALGTRAASPGGPAERPAARTAALGRARALPPLCSDSSNLKLHFPGGGANPSPPAAGSRCCPREPTSSSFLSVIYVSISVSVFSITISITTSVSIISISDFNFYDFYIHDFYF